MSIIQLVFCDIISVRISDGVTLTPNGASRVYENMYSFRTSDFIEIGKTHNLLI